MAIFVHLFQINLKLNISLVDATKRMENDPHQCAARKLSFCWYFFMLFENQNQIIKPINKFILDRVTKGKFCRKSQRNSNFGQCYAI